MLNAYATPYAVNGLLARTFAGAVRGFAPPPLLGPDAAELLNQVRQAYGLPSLASGAGALEFLPGDLNLMCDLPEYAPVREAPAHYRYVGPIVWNGTGERPAWWDHLDPARPTIYFTMGSTGPAESFRAALEAFAGSAYQVVMTTGGVTQPEDLGPTPANFYLARFGPGDELMRRADVAVCHAGNGTVYQALQAGVPLVAWPFIHDQHWNAHRLAELGIGLILPAPTPAALREAVEGVLGNPSYRAAACRFRAILIGYDGPRTAAQLVHEFLRR